MTSMHADYHGDEIAIIGMAGRFPGAATLDQFWHNLQHGVESIAFFSDEELLAEGIDPQTLADPAYIKARGALDDVDRFDASFFDLTPREAEITDPQHRLFLECAWEVLENAGYAPTQISAPVAVFASVSMNTYGLVLFAQPELLASVGSAQAILGNDKDHLSTRVAYKLNLRGPSMMVQSACSSSLVAVHLACQTLLNGESTLALAGGVSVCVPQKSGYWYQEGGIASPDGHCRAFDVRAAGTTGGSGVGIVVLKRLQDALRDGDSIHAVIKGSAVNNDGALRIGYTAPSTHGQADVIAEALNMARVAPETISYVETHGTATPLGDPIEIAALTEAFRSGTERRGFCAIGSVKTNIGHLDVASGMAGLIKTVLALKHHQIPPSLHFEQPNPQIDFAKSPFYVNTRLHDWPRTATPRRAGVSSFGLGGTNAHLILEEAPAPAPTSPGRRHQLLLLSAKTADALEAQTAQLAGHLEQHPELELADVTYTLQAGRAIFEHRRMLVCRDTADALSALAPVDAQRALTLQQARRDRSVVFLFPGVGDQYPGMARDLYEHEPIFREAVDRCCALLPDTLSRDLQALVLSAGQPAQERSATAGIDLRAMVRRERSAEASPLTQTALAHPAIFVVEYALAQLLMAWGVRPVGMIGYSLGEYVAATVAGVLSLEDALRLIVRRAQLIEALPEGAMIAVSLSADAVQPFLSAQINLAAINSATTCVLSGPTAAITALEQQLTGLGVLYSRLEASHAFHSTMLAPLSDSMTELTASVAHHPPMIPYISNVSGSWITAAEATDPRYWERHMCQTVRFLDGLDVLLQDSAHVLLEVGPGWSLSSFVWQHPQFDAAHVALASLPLAHDRQPADAFLLKTLGQLWLSGVAIDWAGVYRGQERQRVALPTYPFERQRYWIARDSNNTSAPASRPAESLRKPDMADWFSLPAWTRTLPQPPPARESARTEPATWLVLADPADALLALLTAQLEHDGHTVVRVHTPDAAATPGWTVLAPDQPQPLLALLRTLAAQPQPPTRILHAWSLHPSPAPAGPAAFAAAIARGYTSLLALAQALSQLQPPLAAELTVLSQALVAVLPADPLRPEQAPLRAAATVLAQEFPALRVRVLDLDQPASPSATTQRVAQLRAELASAPSEPLLAYRAATRWRPTVEPLPLPAAAPTQGLRQGGVYLITGGLGQIGLALAASLTSSVQARVVLLGRRALPPAEQWADWLAAHPADDPTSVQLRKLQALQHGPGELLVLQADVADQQQLEQALAQTVARFGALHGVIHAAGLTGAQGSSMIAETDLAISATQFQPKVQGVYALAAALRDTPLDFCLLCSSLSAVLGGLGFAAYAAGNAFMDAFAQQQHAQGDTTWISVNWDSWRFEQIATSATIGGTLEGLTMTPEEGIAAFQRIIAFAQTPQIIVSTGNLDARIDQWVRLESLHQAATPPRGGAIHPRPALAGPYVAPRSEIEQTIAAMWGEVLGIAQVGVDDNFFELGGNSLIGLQVIARLRATMQVELPLRQLFDKPTVAGLVEQIERAQRDGQLATLPRIRALPRA